MLRILARLAEDERGCWVWPGAKSGGGYGVAWYAGAQQSVHRVVYALYCGPVPEGLDLDHLCRNRACANPAHLEAVTRAVNLQRGTGPEVTRVRHAAVTACPQGHPYDEGNTIMKKHSGKRACRACENARRRRKYSEKTA